MTERFSPRRIDRKVPEVSHGEMCWFDRHPFSGVKYAYPVERKCGYFYVCGCFCSPRCAKGFILTQYDGTYEITNLFDEMIREVLDLSFVSAPTPLFIMPAFNPLSLSGMSIHQYRTLEPSYVTSAPEPGSASRLLGQSAREDFGWGVDPHILCWNDGHPINGTWSYATPLEMRDATFDITGYFCSLNCALRYTVDHALSHQLSPVLFGLLCFQLYGIDPVEVQCPPPRFVLADYGGGGCTIEQYRLGHIRPHPRADGQIGRAHV